MCVIVTGANGFIGSNLINFYKNIGVKIIGIDISKDSLVKGIEYYSIDLSQQGLNVVLSKCNPVLIIHCAGNADVNKSIEYPEIDFRSNVLTTKNLLYSLKENNCYCRIIFMSSAAVYGQPLNLPIKEDFKLSPMSPYALHKVMCEELCLYFRNNYNYDIYILRIFSAYGPGLKKQLFWDMNKKIVETGKLILFGDGTESRDFIYIDDLIDVIYKISQLDKIPYDIINIANGKEITIKEVAYIFVKIKRYNLDVVNFIGFKREGNPNNWCADINKLNSIVTRNRTKIEDGILNYVKWLET